MVFFTWMCHIKVYHLASRCRKKPKIWRSTMSPAKIKTWTKPGTCWLPHRQCHTKGPHPVLGVTSVTCNRSSGNEHFHYILVIKQDSECYTWEELCAWAKEPSVWTEVLTEWVRNVGGKGIMWFLCWLKQRLPLKERVPPHPCCPHLHGSSPSFHSSCNFTGWKKFSASSVVTACHA